MTGTNLNSTILDRAPVVNAVANTQKAKTEAKTQDFGDVLGKAAQKAEQAGNAGTDSKKADTTPKNVDTVAKTDEKATEENTVAESPADDAAAKEPAEDKAAQSKETSETKAAKAEEPVDEMTVDEIADALEQIIEQIKQILGISDEELLAGMEKAGMTEIDLLNPDNMAKLVTAVSGNDSAISLVADEKLYTALKDISEMAETKVGELLDKTGLTDEELDSVLQKLDELAKSEGGELKLAKPQEEVPVPEKQVADGTQKSPEIQESLKTQENVEEMPEGPVIIKEDNTKPVKQQEGTLPQNQQADTAETVMGSKVQTPQREAKNDDGKEQGRFEQNGTQQNFRGNMGETSNAVASEGVAKFTSESTENLLRQLADMVKIVKNENLTEMELQLHPASLGTVNVSLTTKGGTVTAQFTTQNETVKAAIEAQVAQLQAKLEEQGVKVEAVEVTVASHEMERNLDKNGHEQQKPEQENERRIQGTRRRSINLRALEEGSEIEEEILGDDAARIAMEIMTANGNSMDLLV